VVVPVPVRHGPTPYSLKAITSSTSMARKASTHIIGSCGFE